MAQEEGRGRKVQEKVKISEEGEKSRMIPIHESHLEEAGIDPNATQKVKRKPRPEKRTIELVPIDEEDED